MVEVDSSVGVVKCFMKRLRIERGWAANTTGQSGDRSRQQARRDANELSNQKRHRITLDH
jgi:hypothetical protein